MTKLGIRSVGLGLMVALLLAPAGMRAPAAGAPAPAPAQPGKYVGNIVEDGQPSTKEWLRFRVSSNGRKVTSYESRDVGGLLRVPQQLLPASGRVLGPQRPHRRQSETVDKTWTEPYIADGVEYALTGRLQLKFKPGGRVTGQVSIDFASCATVTGDPPYFVPLKAHRV